MSSTTTQKFREFMAEPLGEKNIQDVPGIGDVLGSKLTEAGYEKVCLYLFLYFLNKFFLLRHILYLENIYYLIKILINFKNGFKHNVVQIVINLE